ncbi:hypothetical protein QYQ99_03010 [Comamonas testosteroni]|uniref:hypothetical protein n=1 Tax=Comamonas testosteroni TaxID=285 RepID=UPI00265FAB98|nr:hypothetical protein [Comamonas testosteroni]WKL16539.1 hypothetical protein QYQ99_03010 [Comamonas testosteroni]
MQSKNSALAVRLNIKLVLAATVLIATVGAHAQSSWRMDKKGAAGPVAVLDLPAEGGNNRVAMLAYEYARRCSPLFTYAEIKGRQFGAGEKQMALPSGRAFGSVNGNRYTGPGAVSVYANAVEVGFGMPQDMAQIVTFGKVTSLSFVTPAGKEVSIPTRGLSEAAGAAFEACAQRVGR